MATVCNFGCHQRIIKHVFHVSTGWEFSHKTRQHMTKTIKSIKLMKEKRHRDCWHSQKAAEEQSWSVDPGLYQFFFLIHWTERWNWLRTSVLGQLLLHVKNQQRTQRLWLNTKWNASTLPSIKMVWFDHFIINSDCSGEEHFHQFTCSTQHSDSIAVPLQTQCL